MVSVASKRVLEGDAFSIQLNEKAFLEGLAICKFYLIVRLFLSKGEALWKLSNLKTKLLEVWGLKSWKLFSLVEIFITF